MCVLKGSQRWYSGWSDHGFKSGLPLTTSPVGWLEFSIASSPEKVLFTFINISGCCFFKLSLMAEIFGSLTLALWDFDFPLAIVIRECPDRFRGD